MQHQVVQKHVKSALVPTQPRAHTNTITIALRSASTKSPAQTAQTTLKANDAKNVESATGVTLKAISNPQPQLVSNATAV